MDIDKECIVRVLASRLDELFDQEDLAVAENRYGDALAAKSSSDEIYYLGRILAIDNEVMKRLDGFYEEGGF